MDFEHLLVFYIFETYVVLLIEMDELSFRYALGKTDFVQVNSHECICVR